jgi:hypothetical protein
MGNSLFLSLNALLTGLVSFAAGQIFSRIVFSVDFWLFPFLLSGFINVILGYNNAFIIYDSTE